MNPEPPVYPNINRDTDRDHLIDFMVVTLKHEPLLLLEILNDQRLTDELRTNILVAYAALT